jgi:hypothetical protein
MLTQCDPPAGPLEPDRLQGEPITAFGWRVEGFRTADDTYYERTTHLRSGEVRWYRLED